MYGPRTYALDDRGARTYYPLIMFRYGDGHTLTVSMLSLAAALAVMPVHADVAAAAGILAAARDPAAALVAAADDLVARAPSFRAATSVQADPEMGVLAWYETGPRDGHLSVVAVHAPVGGGAAMAAAVWLAALESASVRVPDARGRLAFVLIDARDSMGTAVPPAAPKPGDAWWRGNGMPDAFAEAGTAALIVLADGPALLVSAEASRRQPPLGVLESVRKTLAANGLRWNEDAGGAFYAMAGLADGDPRLNPWLEAGVPALVLETGVDVDTAENLAAALAGFDGDPGDARSGDTHYLRFPTLVGIVTLPSSVLAGIMLGSGLSLTLLFMARTFLSSGRQRELPAGTGVPLSVPRAAWEALLAMVIMSGSILAMRFLSEGAVLILGAKESVSAKGSLSLTLAFLARIGGLLATYYAVTGVAERLDAMPKTDRGNAVLAAVMLFALASLAALPTAFQIAPLLAAASVVMMLAGWTPLGSALALLAGAASALPFVLPLATGAYPRATAALFRPTGLGFLMQALVAAPVVIWFGLALSPSRRLRRGRRPAFLFVPLAVAAAFAEAAALAFLA